MDDETEYDIVYSIQRRLPGEDDFTEIGFGRTGGWTMPSACAHMLSSDIQNYSWETESHMPDADEIKRDMEATDD